MVDTGLAEETRKLFVPGANYNRGIRRAIGAPELDRYFCAEQEKEDEACKELLLTNAIERIKDNTCLLVERQLRNINRLRNELGREMQQTDAIYVLEKCGKEAENAWEEVVLNPSSTTVDDFFK